MYGQSLWRSVLNKTARGVWTWLGSCCNHLHSCRGWRQFQQLVTLATLLQFKVDETEPGMNGMPADSTNALSAC